MTVGRSEGGGDPLDPGHGNHRRSGVDALGDVERRGDGVARQRAFPRAAHGADLDESHLAAAVDESRCNPLARGVDPRGARRNGHVGADRRDLPVADQDRRVGDLRAGDGIDRPACDGEGLSE